MTTDAAAQLAILADALTEIVDLATGGEMKVSAPPAQVLARAGCREPSWRENMELRSKKAV